MGLKQATKAVLTEFLHDAIATFMYNLIRGEHRPEGSKKESCLLDTCLYYTDFVHKNK